MRVRKYQMRDTDMMVSIWNEAVDACEPLPAEGVIDIAGGNAFFAGQSYCGVAVDFGANVHGFYILNAEGSSANEKIGSIRIALAPSGADQHADIDILKDGIIQAGRLGFKLLLFKAGAEADLAGYEELGFKQLKTLPEALVKSDGKKTDIIIYGKELT